VFQIEVNSMSKAPSSPPSLLRNGQNKLVTVTLRVPSIVLQGILKVYDSYSNIILTDVAEFEKSPEGLKEIRKIEGQVFVKGDSIVHIVF
jgi:small nuclear ribonucleoprotein (snRNP)-like protein